MQPSATMYNKSMKNEYIRQGETFEVTVTDRDDTADTLTITVSDNTGIRVQETSSFTTVDGKRVATVSFTDPDLLVGEYDYMYTITYSDGHVEKLPDISQCDDQDCGLPKIVVCEANDIEGS